MALIVFEHGRLQGKRLVLPDKGLINFGRDPTCQIKIMDFLASRVHCRLRGAEGTWVLEDLQSSNGTFVNGEPITRHVLSAGDLVQVGDSAFSYFLSADDPLVGTTLAGYRFEARLGRGAMGTVYRVRQLSLDRPVALKILAPSRSADPDFVSRFVAEARAAARLNCPNIVLVYDANSAEGRHYIAMEYLAGGTIEQRLLAKGALPAVEVVRVGLDALTALAYAEERDIVHRDVKPGNLLFSGDGRVKLCDLGIALDLRSAPCTADSSTAGSPGYMAPEQILGQPLSHRADLYALGSTLYHALAGEAPYAAPSVKEVLQRKLREDPAPLNTRVPGVPPRLQRVVEKLMARDPAERYATAREASEALAAAANAPAGGQPRQPHRTVRTAARRAPARTSSPAGAIVAVAAVIALFIAVVFFVKQMGRQGAPPPTTTAAAGATQAAAGTTDPAPGPVPSLAPVVRPPELDLRPSRAAPDAEELKQREARVRSLLAQGRLVDAAAELEICVALGVPAGRLAPLQEDLDARVNALVTAEKARVASLCATRAFADARRVVDALRDVLPRSMTLRADALGQLIDEAQGGFRTAKEAVDAHERELFDHMARLDLADLDMLHANFAAGHDGLDRELAVVNEEVLCAADVWRHLCRALEDEAKKRGVVTVSFAPDPLRRGEAPEEKYRILGLSGDRLRVEEAAGRRRREERSVFTADPAFLLSLLAGGEMSEAAAAQGLGILLLGRRGGDRARSLLLTEGVAPERRARNEARVNAWGDAWAAVLLAETRAGLDRLDWSSAAPETWEYYARTGATLMGALRGDSTAVAAAADCYRTARNEHLARGPLDAFFKASSIKTQTGGRVQLEYDFADAAQMSDFVVTGPEGSRAVHVARLEMLELTGEMRFMRGNPFRDELAVAGDVHLCDPAAPNVNVALWTAPEDRVTAREEDLSRDTLGLVDQAVRCQYLVFGIGYRLDLAAPTVFRAIGGRGGGRGGIPGGRVGVPGGRGAAPAGPGAGAPAPGRGGVPGGRGRGDEEFVPAYVRGPVLMLAGAEHGKPAVGVTSRLLWLSNLAEGLRPPFGFSIEMKAGAFRWRVGNRAVPVTGSQDLTAMRSQLSRDGSVTFFTNQKTVHFKTLRIAGAVRPEWVREEAVRMVEAELTALQAAPGGSETASLR